MKPHLPSLCLITILIISGGFSCLKNIDSCAGNCTVLHVAGTTVNRLTGVEEPYVPLQLNWQKPGITIGNTSYVSQLNTSSNGTFQFAVSIDTTRFSGESLIMRVLDGTDYVPANDNSLKDSLRMSFYNSTAFQNLRIGVYNAANLVLKLRKTQTDSYSSLQVTYQYDEDRIFTAYNTDFPDAFKPQDVTVPTAAGLVTTVHVIKGQANGTFKQNDTTIFCSESTNNILELNF